MLIAKEVTKELWLLGIPPDDIIRFKSIFFVVYKSIIIFISCATAQERIEIPIILF